MSLIQKTKTTQDLKLKLMQLVFQVNEMVGLTNRVCAYVCRCSCVYVCVSVCVNVHVTQVHRAEGGEGWTSRESLRAKTWRWR